MANQIGISKVLCKIEGKVKYSSMETGQTNWKTGNLELAATTTGQVVCLVNFNIGNSKKFVVTNKVKGVVFNHTLPRCCINLTSGANINWSSKASPGVQQNKPDDVLLFSRILEDLKNGRKKESRPNTSVNFGIQVSPASKVNTPIKQGVQNPGLRALQHSHQQNSTSRPLFTTIGFNSPKQSTPKTPAASKASSIRTSPNPMTTPSHIKAARGHSQSELVMSAYQPKEEDTTDSDEAGTELSPHLFTEEQNEGNKENTEQKRKSISGSNSRGKSVLQMRKEAGGSLFLASFQEKQLEMEERKENTAPKLYSGIPGFYSRRHSAGYKASDGLLQPKQTNLNIKRIPGFLPVPPPKRSCLSFNYQGWNQRKIPSAIKTSQISLQGFSNLGNTCYMNAILQSLLALERFAMDTLNAELLPYMQKDSLYRALCSLIFAKQSSPSQDDVRMHLHRVKLAISSTAARFSGFMQHDAQEFLCQCLDQLKEDWQKAKQTAPDLPSKDHLQNPHLCPVVRNFEFDVKHSIICKKCGEVVTKEEQFFDLSLDMPKRSSFNPTGSIQTALDQFFREEAIDYACSECECKQAIVKHNFTRLPRTIILHLKRYRFDIDASQNAKVRRRILIPKFLTLYKHYNNETLSPKSVTKPLVNGTASSTERQKLKERGSIKGSTGGKLSIVNSQTKNTSNFSFNSRKRLEFSAGNQPDPVDLQGDTLDTSDLDETQQVLEMSKRDAERAQREQERKRKQEEDELKKAMERSKEDAEKSIIDMSEEQQLAYALAISARDSSLLHPASCDSRTTVQSTSHMGTHQGIPQQNTSQAQLPDVTKETNKISLSLKKRRTHNSGGLADNTLGSSHRQDEEFTENATPWKKFKSDGRTSDQRMPSTNALFGGDSEMELMDDSKNGATKVMPSHNLQNSGVNLFTPIKQISTDSLVALETTELQDTSTKPGLAEATPVGAREEGQNTLGTGENNAAKPTYAELKAKEEEELRRATELSLQDAQEMAKEEEDALKRAKEISLQEFSESFYSPEEENDDAVEPMEIDGASDDDEAVELAKNAESGHLPFSYRLMSVVSHIGTTSAVGHYITDVYDSIKTAWLSYDDSQVVQTSEAAVCEDRQRTGYIFFYVAK